MTRFTERPDDDEAYEAADNARFMADTDQQNDETEPGICPHCSGSGEGQNDGSTCSYCKGKGEI